ncbi:MAG: hypothetical protein IPJ17_16665 [Holophagales bacterium]|nr:MAG: hypothetical protein IPJ17_16665 [Holophagales bacterium]
MAEDAEFEELQARHRAAVAARAREELGRAANTISTFTAFAAARGLQLHSNAFEYVQTIGVVAKAPGIARALSGLRPTERDGLFVYAEIAEHLPPSHLSKGLFVGANYIVMAHPCFRRQMHPNANWAPRFVDLFWAFDAPGIKKYIAIDEDRVRINVDRTSYLELDTWYGAPFNEDVRAIKPGTVKLRPPLDLEPRYVDLFFANSYCLDIQWRELDGIKTFQSLEIKTDSVHTEIQGRKYFPARYLHAEFDMSANCFRHFDGAIQLYSEEEYFRRRDSDFNMTDKTAVRIKARSEKVFKLNGPLATADWVELSCHFYTANPLTFEYFTGGYPENVSHILKKLRASKRHADNAY